MTLRIVTCLLFLSFATAASPVQADPVGPNFRINRTIGLEFVNGAVARRQDGKSLVVWSSVGSNGNGPLLGRSLKANGDPEGNDFRLVASANSQSRNPQVAALSDGTFLVTWTSVEASRTRILGRRYDLAGNAKSNEFVLTRSAYSVAALDGGDFVVASTKSDADGRGVQAQRYSSNGAKVGDVIEVNTETADNQYDPKVVRLDDGGFVIAWNSDEQDGSGAGVYAQRFNKAGAPRGNELQVNTETTGEQLLGSLAARANGGFIVTWMSRPSSSNDTVYGRIYDATGNPAGDAFPVSTNVTKEKSHPLVTELGDGSFAVIWNSFRQDIHRNGVFGQFFAGDGDPLGGEFTVNTVSNGNGNQLSFGLLPLGERRVLAIFTSNEPDIDPKAASPRFYGDNYQIYGQRFRQ